MRSNVQCFFPGHVGQSLAHELHVGLEVEHEAHGAPGLVGGHRAGACHQIGQADLPAEAPSEASHPGEIGGWLDLDLGVTHLVGSNLPLT